MFFINIEGNKMSYVGMEGQNGNFHHHFQTKRGVENSEENTEILYSEHKNDDLDEIENGKVAENDPTEILLKSSAEMFGGINEMLQHIKEEHKLNSDTLLKTNIRKSEYLRNEIKNLTQKSSPGLLSGQLKYIEDQELLISQQGDEISVYVNITKDTPDHEDVDTDGHKVHIHIPHRVLLEMANAGDDHVIHIDIPQSYSRIKKTEVLESETEKEPILKFNNFGVKEISEIQDEPGQGSL